MTPSKRSNSIMAAEFKELLGRIDCSHEKISSASSLFVDVLRQSPGKAQDLVEAWKTSMESSSQKVALLFLANDIIQNSRDDTVKALFQLVLPRAITLVSAMPRHIPDIRKVLKVWEDRNVFGRSVVEEYYKICDAAEQGGARSDHSSLKYIISLAKALQKLKEAQERFELVKEQDQEVAVEALQTEQKARGEYIVELGNAIKKMNQMHIELCMQLQSANEKLDRLRA